MNFKRKKVIGSASVLAAIVATLSCVNFAAQYERVENNRIRLLDFVYEPADAAPGDTILLKAFFAGRTVKPEDINWKVAYRVAMNVYGFDSAFGEQPLNYFSEACTTSEKTTCISLKFIVPQDCIAQSPMVRDDWVQTLPENVQSLVPKELAGMSKTEMLSKLSVLADYITKADSIERTQLAAQITNQFGSYTPLIMQLFTAKIRLYADVKGSHRIRSDVAVSYNRPFARLPNCGVYENHNPVIDSVGVYKVKGTGLMHLDRSGDSTTYSTLYRAHDSLEPVTIVAESGYTYFLEAFVGGRDKVVTLKDMVDNEPVSTEDLSAEWLFQMDEDEMDGYTANDFMNISSLNDLVAALYLPRKEEIKHFTIWVQVTDSKLNVLNRSQGSMVAWFAGEFLYK